MRFTDQEKLVEVERLIENLRHAAKIAGISPEGRAIGALKSIASDLRARRPGGANVALAELDGRVAAVHRTRTSLGFDARTMVGLAQEVIARWPAIGAALERQVLSRDDEIKIVGRTIWTEKYQGCAFPCEWGIDVQKCQCQIQAIDVAMLAVEALDKARLTAMPAKETAL